MDYISRLFSELWSLYITPGLTGSLTESPLSEGARSMDTYQVWVPWHFMAWYLKALFLAPGADPFNPLYTMQPHWPGVWLHPHYQHRPHKITSQAPAHFSGTFCFLFLGKVNKRLSNIKRITFGFLVSAKFLDFMGSFFSQEVVDFMSRLIFPYFIFLYGTDTFFYFLTFYQALIGKWNFIQLMEKKS